jgi:hypothetical protein
VFNYNKVVGAVVSGYAATIYNESNSPEGNFLVAGEAGGVWLHIPGHVKAAVRTCWRRRKRRSLLTDWICEGGKKGLWVVGREPEKNPSYRAKLDQTTTTTEEDRRWNNEAPSGIRNQPNVMAEWLVQKL